MNEEVHQAQSAPNLVRKLTEIMAEVESVEKRGFNSNQNYKYVKVADLANAVRAKLAARNILLLSDTEMVQALNTEKIAILINVRYTFYDADTAETLSYRIPGCGIDGGDKGVYKALTGSLKYALRNAFLIPDESAEPEADEPERSYPEPEQPRHRAAPRAVVAPPVDHTPAMPTEGARPGEPDREVSLDEKTDFNTRYRTYVNLTNKDALDEWVCRFNKIGSPRGLTFNQWTRTLARLAEAHRAGQLPKLVEHDG